MEAVAGGWWRNWARAALAGPIIDGFSIAVCQRARAVRGHVLKAEADHGYRAAKAEYHDGLNAYRLIELRGAVVGDTRTAAHIDVRLDGLLTA